MSGRAWRLPLQFAVAAILLAMLWHLSDGEALAQRLAGANLAWVVAGLAFGTFAMLCGAMRWRYTAGRIGATLGAVESVREFYLAMFLNQVLPGGVSGDAVRAWRHGRRARQQALHGAGPAVRAVIIERVANQMVMALCILASIALWPWMPGAVSVSVWMLLAVAVAVIGVAALALALLSRRKTGGAMQRFFDDAREALVRRGSLPAQVGLGLLVVACCLGMFYCAAHAVDATLSLFHLLALVPATLFAMTIPISIGGWGVREASAMALWTMAGLPAEEALASSILYGVLALVASLPGAVALLVDR